MNRKTFILTALCLVLVLGLMIAPAMAFFTDYTAAEGSVPIELGYKTTIVEEMDGLDKHLTIGNEGPEACWVRAKAIAASDVELEYIGEGWTEDGEWMVFDSILEAGETAELTVKVTLPSGEEAAEKNVVVVYEGTKVHYDENGDPVTPPDWTEAAQITEVIEQ